MHEARTDVEAVARRDVRLERYRTVVARDVRLRLEGVVAAERQEGVHIDVESSLDAAVLDLADVAVGKERRQRERRDRVPYLQWIRQGFINATPGEVVDYDCIRRRINELGQRFDIRFDQLFTITNMPISRFGAVLLAQGEYLGYMQLLRDNLTLWTSDLQGDEGDGEDGGDE